MAKKTSKTAKSNELDGKEFFCRHRPHRKRKGIPKNYMLEKITQALISAYKRDHEGITDNVFVEANEITGDRPHVCEKGDRGGGHQPLHRDRPGRGPAVPPSAQTGDVVRIEIKPRNFGRIAAQTARQVIIQGMREAEHSMIYDMFSSKEHEMLMGTVTRVDPRNGAVSPADLQQRRVHRRLPPPAEQVPGEVIREGDRLKVYVVEVRRSSRGAPGPHLPHPPRPGQAPVRAGGA